MHDLCKGFGALLMRSKVRSRLLEEEHEHSLSFSIAFSLTQ